MTAALRSFLCILLTASLVLAAPPAPLKLTEGTPVLLVNQEKLVSGETPEGANLKFKVDRDVLGPKGEVLIPAGANAQGTCVKSSGSGFFGRAGELNLTVDSVQAADGTYVPLRSFRSHTASDQETGVIVGAVLLSVFFVFMEGDDVVIPPGTLLTGYVKQDTAVAKPGPARGPVAPHTTAMVVPANGQKVVRHDKMTYSCSCQPDDPNAYVRMYFDNTLVKSQKGDLNKIEWDAGHFDKISEPGEHTVYVEVTWSSGQVVRSNPVKFTLIED